MRAAYQGAPGAFGHEACRAFLPGCEPVAKPDFPAVVAAVAEGETGRGVLPLENNEAGDTGARALIRAAGLETLAEHWLPVRMHLLALPGVALEDVRVVASHPVALRQCSRLLERLRVRTEAAANTAVAARDLSARDTAVLASEAAAAAYGLTILTRDVHDRPDNATLFAVLARGSA
ncbi:MAG: prephenate dehydratase domain-containing protein [Allosphingosinicella sp.]